MERGWAVVTGASRGIGAAIAERLAADGFGIIAVATTDEALASARQSIEQVGGRFESRPCDLADRAALRALTDAILADHPEVSALVNCAGIVRVGPIEAFDGADWDEVVEVNLRAAFELSRALVPVLAARATSRPGSASIVNISSVMGLLASPGIISYVATKGAHRPPDPRPRGRARPEGHPRQRDRSRASSGRRCSTRTTRRRARRPSAAPIRWGVSVRPRRSQRSPRSSARSKPASSRAPSSPSTAASRAISPIPSLLD